VTEKAMGQFGRIATAVEWLAKGKLQNWRYEK